MLFFLNFNEENIETDLVMNERLVSERTEYRNKQKHLEFEGNSPNLCDGGIWFFNK
jgi:hypothetical protein